MINDLTFVCSSKYTNEYKSYEYEISLIDIHIIYIIKNQLYTI